MSSGATRFVHTPSSLPRCCHLGQHRPGPKSWLVPLSRRSALLPQRLFPSEHSPRPSIAGPSHQHRSARFTETDVPSWCWARLAAALPTPSVARWCLAAPLPLAVTFKVYIEGRVRCSRPGLLLSPSPWLSWAWVPARNPKASAGSVCRRQRTNPRFPSVDPGWDARMSWGGIAGPVPTLRSSDFSYLRQDRAEEGFPLRCVRSPNLFPSD